jgi:hypothetical protein
MPDPNIQEAIAEINEILRARELAAIVLVASPTHTQFDLKLDAPWNVIRFERGPQGEIGIRIRLKTADYPTKEEAKRVAELTLGTLMGLVRVMDAVRPQLQAVVDHLAREVGLERHVDLNEGPDIEGIKRQHFEP